MLKWFRRQRLLAALLVLANPALIGSWVTAYHPCPVRDGAVAEHAAPVASAAAMEHMGHMGMVDDVPPAPPHDHDQNAAPCSCIGQCLTSGAALVPVAGDEVLVTAEVTQHPAPSTQYTAVLPASRPLDLLPPSTAPPIA